MKKLIFISVLLSCFLTGCNISNSALVINNYTKQDMEINIIDDHVIGINDIIVGNKPNANMLKESIINTEFKYYYNNILFNVDKNGCINEILLQTNCLDNYVINIQGKVLIGIEQIETELGLLNNDEIEYHCDNSTIVVKKNKDYYSINIIKDL